MIVDSECWMNIRRFHVLHQAGATYAEIARECGCDPRTVRKYLAEDADCVPPAAPSRLGSQPRLIEPFIELVESWLRTDLRLKVSVIHERLVTDYGFTGHYQRVKIFAAEARPRIAAELAEQDENPLTGLHRRFEVLPGAQAQVDWGDEGDLLAHVGIGQVYSFHMILSYSRDPFCCFTTGMDLATFWDCHRRAFAHFGGVPGSIVYDRTKTVIRRHVAPGVAVPLHPEAAAFAGHYGFSIDVLAAYRPTGKGRGTAGQHCAGSCARRSPLRLDRRPRRLLRGLAADPPIPDPSHPRPGDRNPCRGRPGCFAAVARRALPGGREASAAGRQGLPDLLRRQLLFGAGPAGPRRTEGASPRRTGHHHH
jgi:transposase